MSVVSGAVDVDVGASTSVGDGAGTSVGQGAARRQSDGTRDAEWSQITVVLDHQGVVVVD